jgi:anti-sigma regulatory factor (Ser/Thr protein kinase)
MTLTIPFSAPVTRSTPLSLAARALRCRRERGKRAAISLDGRMSTTPATARAFVRLTAVAWGLPRSQADDLVLIVSELATNAIRHTDSRTVTVTAVYVPGAVVVSVVDGGPYRPLAVAHAGDQAEGHRGLAIVAALAETWGHQRAGTGTRAWARVTVPLGVVSVISSS